MGRECSTNSEEEEDKEKKRNVYSIVVGKQERKRPLRRPKRMWVDIIKMDLGMFGWAGMHWIDLSQDSNR
jgi:hypothetical protein